MDGKTVRALYRILESPEVEEDELQLETEELDQLRSALELLGFRLVKWHDQRTLVAVTKKSRGLGTSETDPMQKDVFLSVASSENGIPCDALKNCTAAQSLIKGGWIQAINGRLRLSKRSMLEHSDILKEQAGLGVCSFCSIVNGEGNTPHTLCSRYALKEDTPNVTQNTSISSDQ